MVQRGEADSCFTSCWSKSGTQIFNNWTVTLNVSNQSGYFLVVQKITADPCSAPVTGILQLEKKSKRYMCIFRNHLNHIWVLNADTKFRIRDSLAGGFVCDDIYSVQKALDHLRKKHEIQIMVKLRSILTSDLKSNSYCINLSWCKNSLHQKY